MKNISNVDIGKALSMMLCQLMAILVFTSISYAQATFTVTGKVTDETGGGLPGVNIAVKGTTTGTTTDANGNYSLAVPDANGTLVFSFVGYNDEEIQINNQSVIEPKLTPSIESLKEVVVQGYGTTTREKMVGSVGVAGQRDFGNVVATQSAQLIQGKIAGVQVTGNGSIIVRGSGSFTSLDPLYVIDGIQADGGLFNSINPADIESITVLKDAASVAIYGAQGANGVVIVTTKRGKTGAPRVTYNSYFGYQQASKLFEPLNARDYTDFVKEYQKNTNSPLPPIYNDSSIVQVDRTDWNSVAFRTARVMFHSLGISGGSEKATYNLTVGYLNEENIKGNWGQKRLNIKSTTEQTLGKRLKFGQNIFTTFTSNAGNLGDLTSAIRMPPYFPTIDINNEGGFARPTSDLHLNDAGNPMNDLFNINRYRREFRLYSQLYGEVDIIEGLKFRTQATFDFSSAFDYEYRKEYRAGNILNNRRVTTLFNNRFVPLIENILFYKRDIGEHSISLTAGNTYRAKGTFNEATVVGTNMPNDAVPTIGVAPSLAAVFPANRYATPVLISFFGRAEYAFMNKYLASVTFRRDGTSVFGAQNRFGNFPAVGLGWRVSEEDFMKNIPVISDLKVRASWGKLGNSNIDPFLYQAYIFRGAQNNIVYPFGNNKGYLQGSTIADAFNADLKWEETIQRNIGIDFGLWEKLNFTVDIYSRDNNDLLVNVPVPLSTGIGRAGDLPKSTRLVNAASMNNRGVEVTGNYNTSFGDFKLSIMGNLAYNKNKVISMGDTAVKEILGGATSPVAYINSTRVDQPLGAFYGYQVDHIAINAADVAAYNAYAKQKLGDINAVYQNDLRPGDIIFKDLNGDGQITDKDQTTLGSPMPKFIYGGNINLAYKNFDFMVGLQGVSGVKIANMYKVETQGMVRPFNYTTAILDRWREPGDIASVPKAGQGFGGDQNLRPSSYFIESGNYLRVRNLTLGYTIPNAFLKQWTNNTVSNFRIYVTGQNLFTFTKYSGYDPEITWDPANSAYTTFSRGVDTGRGPLPRIFMAGVQVGF